MCETSTNSYAHEAKIPDTRIVPSRMTLLVWLVASTTTVFSLVLALNDDASTQRFLGLLLVGVIVAVGCLKAWLILRFYLGLGPAAGGWRGIFIAFLIVIFVDVFAAQSAIILMTS